MRNASTSLKTIASAQADFRANDRDWNHVNDYWRDDIVGAGDDRPTTNIGKYAIKSPKAGFWYRALPHADEKTRGPDRFAACTFPESLAAGRWGTYVVSEENVIRKRMLGHAKGIEAYPAPVDLQAKEWEKID